MPAFNEESYIAEAIRSVLAQTYSNWELIVVDDGSTDDTAAIVSRFSDPRIHLIRQENEGRSAARNRVIEKAQGKYIVTTDADDLSLPDRFEKQVSYLEAHPDIDVVSGQMKYFADTLPPIMLFQYSTNPEKIQKRFDKGATGVIYQACMYRRKMHHAVGAYEPQCVEAEDLDFFLRARHAHTFAAIPDLLILYRSDPRTFSLQRWQRTHRYAEYAVYRSYCLKSNTLPISFRHWLDSQSPSLIRWLSDIIRYLRFQLILHAQTTIPVRGPHSL